MNASSLLTHLVLTRYRRWINLIVSLDLFIQNLVHKYAAMFVYHQKASVFFVLIGSTIIYYIYPL